MKRLLAIIAVSAVIAGCGTFHKDEVKPVVTEPVVITKKEVRYVPIDSRLVELLPGVPPYITYGDALESLKIAEAWITKANIRFACIAAIADTPVPPGGPPCGDALAPAPAQPGKAAAPRSKPPKP